MQDFQSNSNNITVVWVFFRWLLDQFNLFRISNQIQTTSRRSFYIRWLLDQLNLYRLSFECACIKSLEMAFYKCKDCARSVSSLERRGLRCLPCYNAKKCAKCLKVLEKNISGNICKDCANLNQVVKHFIKPNFSKPKPKPTPRPKPTPKPNKKKVCTFKTLFIYVSLISNQYDKFYNSIHSFNLKRCE